MSGVCGIIHFDGELVDAKHLMGMAQAAAYRGPDGIAYLVEGNVGFCNLALNITPEAFREKQPLVDPLHRLVLTADARIDNRDELLPLLSDRQLLNDAAQTDAEYILAAYAAWGHNCIQYLIGDFAFVIWDAEKRQLFAAVDRNGCRALHYAWQGQSLLFSTDAIQILAYPGFVRRLNEKHMAHYLVSPGYVTYQDTFYEGIYRLCPAESLVASAGDMKLTRYWDYDPAYTLTYPCEEDYKEHFLELFRRAVRDRLRTVHPVGVLMSGGMDSTSVAAMVAHELAHNPAGLTPRMEVISWDTLRWPEFREIERGRAVATQWGFSYHEIIVDSLWPGSEYPQYPPHPDEPHRSHFANAFRASLAYGEERCRPVVWLSGMTADSLIGDSNPDYYFYFLRKLQWYALFKTLRQHSQMYGQPLKETAWQHFFVPLYQRLRSWPPLSWRRRRLPRARLPDWISPGLVERTDLLAWQLNVAQTREQYLSKWIHDGGGRDKAQRYYSLHLPFDVFIRIWLERLSAIHGQQPTSPFDDIRLASFCLAIPSVQHAQGINHKLLLRGAMQSYLPDSVRERRGSRTGAFMIGSQTPLTEESRQIQRRLFEHSRLAELDLVDTQKLWKFLEQGYAYRRRLKIDNLIHLECWLRSIMNGF
jgi:asparagine synthase (glutamine-hydrolysing)